MYSFNLPIRFQDSDEASYKIGDVDSSLSLCTKCAAAKVCLDFALCQNDP